MSIEDKYKEKFKLIKKRLVIDPASYYEYFAYQLICENNNLKPCNKVKVNLKIIDNKPVSHAKAGYPDIEVYLLKLAFIVELTLKSGKAQFDDEHESTSRHFEDFVEKNKRKYDYFGGLLISPKLSYELVDWYFILYDEITIVPLTTDNFVKLMVILANKKLNNYEQNMIDLYAIKNKSSNKKNWIENINSFILKLK